MRSLKGRWLWRKPRIICEITIVFNYLLQSRKGGRKEKDHRETPRQCFMFRISKCLNVSGNVEMLFHVIVFTIVKKKLGFFFSLLLNPSNIFREKIEMQRKEDSDNIKQLIIENHNSSWNLKCLPLDLEYKIKFAFFCSRAQLQSSTILT